MIHVRKDDHRFLGKTARLAQLDVLDSLVSVYLFQKDYQMATSTYGRITDTGTFTVKGYLVEQVGPDIGKETFVAGSTITTTP